MQHGVRIAWFCWLAGLPHLLLSARHLPQDVVALPIVLRRAAVVLGVLLAVVLLVVALTHAARYRNAALFLDDIQVSHKPSQEPALAHSAKGEGAV